jgi:putative transposase
VFGFYALNGVPVLISKIIQRKKMFVSFLREILFHNPGKGIVLILDNFPSHRSKDSAKCAEECGIKLIILPPYSPDLNPIEFIWKSMKRVISRSFK